MPACPCCFGERYIDHRDFDAALGEQFSDEELDRMRADGLVHPAGVVPCGECEATGVVSEERAAELRAAAVAAVDQALAKLADEDSA